MSVSYQPNPYQPMQKVRFEWIGEAWQLFTARAGTWILTILVLGLISLAIGGGGFFGLGLPRLFSQIAADPTNRFLVYESPGYWGLFVIGSLMSAYFTAGLMQMANAEVRRQPVSLGMVFGGGPVFVPMLLLNLIYNACNIIANVVSPFIAWLPLLLIAPVILPAMPLIADGEPIGTALGRGWNVIKTDYFKGVLLVVVYGLLLVAGVIPCGLGLFAVYPMGYIMLALLYRDMLGMPNAPVVDPFQGYGAPAQPGVWPPSPGQQTPTQPNPYAAPVQPVQPTPPSPSLAPIASQQAAVPPAPPPAPAAQDAAYPWPQADVQPQPTPFQTSDAPSPMYHESAAAPPPLADPFKPDEPAAGRKDDPGTPPAPPAASGY